MLSSTSQAGQDKFFLSVLNYKRDGFFLEIGSNHPKDINNTYNADKYFNWTGIMIEYDVQYLSMYQKDRPRMHHIIQDATTIDYKILLEKTNAPVNIDYLQIDLDVDNRSTIDTLELLDKNIFDTYKFAVVTFEHDIYRGDYFNTRQRSRDIFDNRGYVRVFSDVKFLYNAFEDWYVHPDLVDMDYINNIRSPDSLESYEIISRLTR